MENNPNNKKQHKSSVYVEEPQLARNENPRANENIRVRTEEPDMQNTNATEKAGSEITDGEDG